MRIARRNKMRERSLLADGYHRSGGLAVFGLHDKEGREIAAALFGNKTIRQLDPVQFQLADADLVPPNPEPPANDGRRAELEQLINKHNDELVSHIYRRVGSRETARDIVQEAFLRIFRLGNLRAVDHLRGFLYQTARNIAVDWLRKRVVRKYFATEEALRTTQEDFRTPDRICLATEELEILKHAFELLPPRTQIAVRLIREDGLNYEDVGKRLGIKTPSARRLVERAMEFLLEAVSPDDLNTRRKRRNGPNRLPKELNHE